MSETARALVVHDTSGTSLSRQVTGISGIVARLVRNWRNRQELVRLELLDDHLLEDIGLMRSDVERLLSLPLTHDPVAALHRTVADNRAQKAHDMQVASCRAQAAHIKLVTVL